MSWFTLASVRVRTWKTCFCNLLSKHFLQNSKKENSVSSLHWQLEIGDLFGFCSKVLNQTDICKWKVVNCIWLELRLDLFAFIISQSENRYRKFEIQTMPFSNQNRLSLVLSFVSFEGKLSRQLNSSLYHFIWFMGNQISQKTNLKLVTFLDYKSYNLLISTKFVLLYKSLARFANLQLLCK